LTERKGGHESKNKRVNLFDEQTVKEKRTQVYYYRRKKEKAERNKDTTTKRSNP